MWSLVNHTPYKAESTWGRDKDGVHEWIVVVKATYTISPSGELELADEQLDPLYAPEFRGEDGASSLRYEADMVAPKPTTDILLNGTAYAPRGQPASEFMVALRVGPVHKQLLVRGHRIWRPGLLGPSPSKPEAIVSVPIEYERAYGGFDQADPNPKKQKIDPRNPVGSGIAEKSEDLLGRPAPNFEYPDRRLSSAGPAGYGALASFWSPRLELQGTYDSDWEKTRKPLLPKDWDPRSLLCAPEDQRPERYLRGGEEVLLQNLTPEGVLSFKLPRVRFSFRTELDGAMHDHRADLSTVILEPDDRRVVLVWTTSLTVRSEVDYLERTVIREKQLL